MRRWPVTATIMVADHSRLIIAARRLPSDWYGPISDDAIAAYAKTMPGWDYMVAGAQSRHRFRAGGTILHEGAADRWA